MILLALLLQVVLIGSHPYTVEYWADSLGFTQFPADDKWDGRAMVLPTMPGQLPVSWMHERLHACMHDHEHNYKTAKELSQHLKDQTYTEEEIVTILTPCMLSSENVDLRKTVPRKKK